MTSRCAGYVAENLSGPSNSQQVATVPACLMSAFIPEAASAAAAAQGALAEGTAHEAPQKKYSPAF